MATILKANQREFKETPDKTDPFRIFTDTSRAKMGINPENLNFDLRSLQPGKYSAPFHFHQYAEELFMILSGSVTLRTHSNLEIVNSGDILFFEKGESGAHQLYNHGTEACVYLDIRTFIGFDLCEYPDSNKIYIAPAREIYNRQNQANYFDGEDNIREKWDQLQNKTGNKIK